MKYEEKKNKRIKSIFQKQNWKQIICKRYEETKSENSGRLETEKM